MIKWIDIRIGVESIYLNSSSAIILHTLGISKWVSCRLIHRLRSWWACFVRFISLGGWYGNIFISRRGSRGISLFMSVMIRHNIKSIWKRIRPCFFGLAPQLSILKIEILACGHFGGLFDKVLPVLRDGTFLRVRHSTTLIVKDYVALWNNTTCSSIPYKCKTSSAEGLVSKIHPIIWTWLPFWWAYSSSILDPSIYHINWSEECVKLFY